MSLSIHDLTVSYTGAAQTVTPLQHFDLRVEPEQLTLLHGPSGCGKTTLLSAVAGLVTPTSGRIDIDGVEVTSLTRRQKLRHRQTHIGIVFQAFNLIPSLTALENVSLPLRINGVGRREARGRAQRVLEELDMAHRTSHRPDELSGGQQQRVAIARAIVADPEVLLADEPTAHLDHEQIVGVRSILRTLADRGRVVLVSTHDDRLRDVADVVTVMASGPPAARVLAA